jgi:glycerol-3-phosphate O-acyltransferase
MELDYHKNTIIHFVVEPATLATALRSFAGQAAPVSELFRRAKELSRLLKHEFVFPPGRNFDATVEENLGLLLRWGLATRDGELVTATTHGARQLRLLAELMRPFGEGLWVAADALQLLLAGPMEPKEWLRGALDRGRAAYLAGRVQRLEALLKPTLENALLLFRDRSVLVPAEGKGAKLQLTQEWTSRERLMTLAAEVDPYLR